MPNPPSLGGPTFGSGSPKVEGEEGSGIPTAFYGVLNTHDHMHKSAPGVPSCGCGKPDAAEDNESVEPTSRWDISETHAHPCLSVPELPTLRWGAPRAVEGSHSPEKTEPNKCPVHLRPNHTKCNPHMEVPRIGNVMIMQAANHNVTKIQCRAVAEIKNCSSPFPLSASLDEVEVEKGSTALVAAVPQLEDVAQTPPAHNWGCVQQTDTEFRTYQDLVGIETTGQDADIKEITFRPLANSSSSEQGSPRRNNACSTVLMPGEETGESQNLEAKRNVYSGCGTFSADYKNTSVPEVQRSVSVQRPSVPMFQSKRVPGFMGSSNQEFQYPSFPECWNSSVPESQYARVPRVLSSKAAISSDLEFQSLHTPGPSTPGCMIPFLDKDGSSALELSGPKNFSLHSNPNHEGSRIIYAGSHPVFSDIKARITAGVCDIAIIPDEPDKCYAITESSLEELRLFYSEDFQFCNHCLDEIGFSPGNLETIEPSQSCHKAKVLLKKLREYQERETNDISAGYRCEDCSVCKKCSGSAVGTLTSGLESVEHQSQSKCVPGFVSSSNQEFQYSSVPESQFARVPRVLSSKAVIPSCLEFQNLHIPGPSTPGYMIPFLDKDGTSASEMSDITPRVESGYMSAAVTPDESAEGYAFTERSLKELKMSYSRDLQYCNHCLDNIGLSPGSLHADQEVHVLCRAKVTDMKTVYCIKLSITEVQSGAKLIGFANTTAQSADAVVYLEDELTAVLLLAETLEILMPAKSKSTKHDLVAVDDIVVFITQDGGYGDTTWRLGRVIEVSSPNSVKIEYHITNGRSGDINVKTVHRLPRSCSRVLDPKEYPVNSQGFFEVSDHSQASQDGVELKG